MIWLILGLALWVTAHLFKRVFPDLRARMGDKGKALFGVEILLAVVLMVIGYRMAEGAVFWGVSPAMVGINNLLMVLAFYVYASGATPPGRPRNWIGTKTRHPQLWGFSIWAVAHLLVNGDVPSFILFGGLLVWALVAMAMINAREPEWTPPAHGGVKTEVRIGVIALVVLVVVMLIHNWLGVSPWG